MLVSRQGDTIIEVLFAIVVFSLVAVSTFAIMNQGAATSQRALEITLVRQEVDAQATALRFMHSAYISAYQDGATYDAATPAGQWKRMVNDITSSGITAASEFGNVSTCSDSSPVGSFIINTRTAQYVNRGSMGYEKAATVAGTVYDSDASTTLTHTDGLWVEAVRSANSSDPNQATVGYIDFHIRACWDSVGLDVPMTIGTIVRLYEPR